MKEFVIIFSFDMMVDRESKVEFKIGNCFVSMNETEVFIENVELDKELVRMITNEAMEMIIDMINDEFNEKEHSIAKRFFEEIIVVKYKGSDEVKKAENFHTAKITLDELEHSKAVREVKVKNRGVLQGEVQDQNIVDVCVATDVFGDGQDQVFPC